MFYPNFNTVKPEIRILGIDDGVFIPHEKGLVLVVGVVFRGGHWLDGVMHTKIKVDGFDATEKIVSMTIESPHHNQLRVIMLNGITFAGFNVVNIQKINTKTGLPVIVVTKKKPNFAKIKKALENLAQSESRWEIIENTGLPIEVLTRCGREKVYMQIAGISEEDAKKIIKLTSTRSSIPEALRVAHLVASGVSSFPAS